MMQTYRRAAAWLTWSIGILFLLLPTVSHACVWYDPEDGRVWMFAPNLVDIPGLMPFTYTYERYYAPYNYPDRDPAYYHTNVAEWQAAVAGSTQAADVYKILYQTTPEDYARKKNWTQNSFMAALARKDNAHLKAYLDFAKQCEALMNDGDRPWSDDPNAGFDEAITKAKTLLEAAPEGFVKHRLAYQLMKLYEYSNQYAEGLATYRQHIETIGTDTWVKGSALYHYALMQPDSIERHFQYTRAFDAFEGNRFVIQLNFEKKLRDALLRRAQNNREKAAIELLVQLDNAGRGLAEMENIYQLAPDYDKLRMLMAREVNKLEDWILSPRLLASSSYEYWQDAGDKAAKKAMIEDLKYLKSVRAFAEKVVKEGKQPDLAFWRLSAGYLGFIDGDYGQAKALLADIQQREQLPLNFQLQLGVTEALISIVENPKVTADTDAKLFQLYAFMDKNKNTIPEMARFRSEVTLFISDWMIRQGARAKGALLLSQCNVPWGDYVGVGSKNHYHKLLDIGEPADFEEAIRILEQPKTTFERWLSNHPNHVGVGGSSWGGVEYKGKWYYPGDEDFPLHLYAWNTNRIRDYHATYHMRRDDLKAALAIFKTIPDSYWTQPPYNEYLTTNPFSVGIHLPTAPSTAPLFRVPTSKADFVETLISLQNDNYGTKEKRAETYLLIGNAYYQMTYYGRWWLMMMPAKSENEAWMFKPESEGDYGATDAPDGALPKAVWGMGLLLLVGGLRFTPWRQYARSGLMVALPLVYLVLLPASSCNPAEGNGGGTPQLEQLKDPNLRAYYLAERAVQWYERCLAEAPKAATAPLAAFMLDKIANDVRELTSTPNYDAQPTPMSTTRLQSLSAGKVQINPSCQTFNDAMRQHGWTMDASTAE